ncbi:Pentatricopeptide repeat-containing protein [Camellia lanceoleosa]|uniref:Pentatricopeptide repeat-containing protein n=1 Tax=Camellia lanceoleosa TaxID=1840588 RepID=A0ACC0G683_9ERIC|nr:Pentatricopeptide repeat-containing protein [Camellia lanceoleosa]
MVEVWNLTPEERIVLTFNKDLQAVSTESAPLSHHGCGAEAISLFKEMKNLGIKPNDVTYVGLLAACSHAGLTDEGLKYFDELIRDKSIQVQQDHYSCLVDLCGRAGRLKEDFDFIQRPPIEPSASSGELREVAKLRLKMKDKGLKKQPGYSWIDVRKKVHVFVVGDKPHRETNLTYSLIHDLHVKMKKVGHVSDDDFTMEEDFRVT